MSVLGWLTLKAVRGLGERSIKKLYLNLGSAEDILDVDLTTLEELVGKERAKSIKSRNLSFEPEKVLRTLEEQSIGCITLEHKDYPKSLFEIEDPPPVLFVLGELKNMPFIGVVGTRNPHEYSLEYTRELVKNIVGAGYGVVSGGARGIDFTAHSSCVSSGGYTVCVLGMGISHVPSKLRETVLRSGCLVSEFLPDEHPDKFRFPRRNRIISGLSQSVVVIEAGEKSGALITAGFAKMQSRRVYVHVGYGKSERWRGCVNLINREGAKFIMKPEEIKDIHTPHKPTDDPLLFLLTEPKTVDELVQLSGLSQTEILVRLTAYEMEGRVRKMGGRFFLA